MKLAAVERNDDFHLYSFPLLRFSPLFWHFARFFVLPSHSGHVGYLAAPVLTENSGLVPALGRSSPAQRRRAAGMTGEEAWQEKPQNT